MRGWLRQLWRERGRWLALAVVAVAFLTAGRSVFATSDAQPPTATPVPTLTPTQVRADRSVRTFFAYYDRRDISGILSLLARHFIYLDCNYRRHVPVSFDSRPALRRWLLARFRDHDYFGPLGRLVSDPGPGKVGVIGLDPVIRFSDSLVPLASKGLLPQGGQEAAGFKDGVLPNGRIQQVHEGGDCSAGAPLTGSRPRRERALARAFLTAYNHHNVSAVVRLLSSSVVYGDCGTAGSGQATGISQVQACLRSLFTEGDTFAKAKIILTGYLSQLGPPNTIMIQALRINSQLLSQGDAPQVITLDLETNVGVTRIRQLEEWLPPTQ